MAQMFVSEPEPPAPPPPPPPPPAASAADVGLRAVVLYEYEAGEDNEMALVEGEVIQHVEQLDEGWWSGVSQDGTRSGLFPANYVELIEEVYEPEPEDEAPPPPPPPRARASQTNSSP